MLNLPLPFTVDQVQESMMETYGMDCFALYCVVTGKPYGNIGHYELEDNIRFVDEDDLETYVDDLAVRMIAGMRPSLNWSRVEPVSIEFARHNDKAGLLAYLIHRANENKTPRDMAFADILDRNVARIRSYRMIAALVDEVDTFELTQLLLQADSIGNLHRFPAPRVALNEHNRIVRVKPSAMGSISLFHYMFLTPEYYPSLVTAVRTWVEDIMEQIEKESRIAMADARFASTQGNRLTTQAYTRSWMEKPVSALSRERQAKNALKKAGLTNKDGSTSKSRVKKMIREEEAMSLLAQVEQMLKGPALASAIAASSPKAKPVLRFGAKK